MYIYKTGNAAETARGMNVGGGGGADGARAAGQGVAIGDDDDDDDDRDGAEGGRCRRVKEKEFPGL